MSTTIPYYKVLTDGPRIIHFLECLREAAHEELYDLEAGEFTELEELIERLKSDV